MGKTGTEPNSESNSEDFVALIEKTFADPEAAIVALEAGLAAESGLAQWRSAEDRSLVRARLLARLGEIYEKRQQGDRSDNLEKALAVFEEAGRLQSQAGVPMLRAQVQHNLGRVYLDRVLGDRADNIERAIGLNDAALQVHTRKAFPGVVTLSSRRTHIKLDSGHHLSIQIMRETI